MKRRLCPNPIFDRGDECAHAPLEVVERCVPTLQIAFVLCRDGIAGGKEHVAHRAEFSSE
ncbi:MAG: hypothetical protein IT305_05220 [Chloroflexi bacterium]|nr:hypothetical protein [Chloroflexota bacterium]